MPGSGARTWPRLPSAPPSCSADPLAILGSAPHEQLDGPSDLRSLGRGREGSIWRSGVPGVSATLSSLEFPRYSNQPTSRPQTNSP